MMTNEERRSWERERERSLRGSPRGCFVPAAVGAAVSFLLMLPVALAIGLSDDGRGEPAGQWGTGALAIVLPRVAIPAGAMLGLGVAAIFRKSSGD